MKRALLSLLLFSTLITFSQNDSCNCCTEVYKEFDFWVGNWETFNPNGDLAGTNVIDKIQDNCILRENWTSAKGNYTGTSYNFYNKKTKQWEQIWVDNQGVSLHLKGTRVGNQMILVSDATIDIKGNTVYNKVTWTKNEDESVRQLWETSSDNNEWKVVFNGLYKKK